MSSLSFKKISGIILLHFFAWITLFSFLIAGGVLKPVHQTIMEGDIRSVQLLLTWLMIITFVYFHHFFIIPNFYLTKDFVYYFSITFILVSIIFLISEMIDPNHMPPPGFQNIEHSGINLLRMKDHAIHFLMILIFTLGSHFYYLRVKVLEIEKNQLKVELNNLKSQIKPHFLFNTLNSIYSLSFTNPELTSEAILQLSHFLRYLFKEGSESKVMLKYEIEYLENYINLQKWRYDKTVHIHFTTEGDPGELTIAPLLFFSYVENAFHYGVSPEEKSNIEIYIKIKSSFFEISIKNSKVDNIFSRSSTGLGQDNTKRRLNILYPDHILKISEDNDFYEISLFLDLKNEPNIKNDSNSIR